MLLHGRKLKQRKRGRRADNLHDIGYIPKTESEGISKGEVQEKYTTTLESRNDLAVLYREQGNYAKAESRLIEALEGRRLKLGDTHPHTKESLNNLITFYEVWNKPEKANEWQVQLEQIEDFED